MSDIKVRHQEILENGVYSPCEVASLLKLEMEAIYRYLREKKIPSFAIDVNQKRPRRRVKGSDLLDWIEKQKENLTNS